MQEISQNSRFTFSDFKAKADNIEKLYSEAEIKINTSSQLWGMLAAARELSDKWENRKDNLVDMKLLFKSLHIERIDSALSLLSEECDRKKYLKAILKGNLDFFIHERSHAKDILWELEAWKNIKRVIPNTQLDEPDVVVNLSGIKISIPCKKIYSEKGVSKVLSNAVSQIERSFEFGMVAMNIDDLMPEEKVLIARIFDEAANKLHSINMEFLANHQRHFLKYLSKSRITAVIVSTSIVTEIHDESPRFNNASQWAIWTVPDIKSNHKRVIDEFKHKVLG